MDNRRSKTDLTQARHESMEKEERMSSGQRSLPIRHLESRETMEGELSLSHLANSALVSTSWAWCNKPFRPVPRLVRSRAMFNKACCYCSEQIEGRDEGDGKGEDQATAER